MRKMTRCSCKACQCRRMRCCGCSWCGGCRLPLSWCSCRWSQTERSSEVVLHQKSSGWLMMSSSWIGRRTHLTFLTLAWDQWRDQLRVMTALCQWLIQEGKKKSFPQVLHSDPGPCPPSWRCPRRRGRRRRRWTCIQGCGRGLRGNETC